MSHPEAVITKTSGCAHCPEPGAFSPSQIKLFSLSCQRKWAFRHILKLPEPERSFQTLGKEVHAHNEAYIEYGTVPPSNTKSGQIANAGLGQLPAPSPLHTVEKHLYFKTGGIAFHGFADLMPHHEPSVYDYKTTASYQYALTSADLATDPQGLIYAMARFLREDDHAPVKLVWLYYKTKPPFTTRRVEAELSPAALFKNFAEHVLPPAQAMQEIRDAADHTYDPNELPGNLGACNSYGGCPYMSQCNLHVKESFGMMFADKMKAKKLQDTPDAVAAAAKSDAEAIDAAYVQAQVARAQAAIHAEADAYVNRPRGAVGVVPPDAPEPVAELPPEPVKVKAATGAKRGRPKKIVAPPVDAGDDSVPMPHIDASGPPVGSTEYEVVLRTNPEPDGFVLCINTMPMGSAVTMLSEILQPIIAELAAQLKVSHFRLSDAAGYGRADALLLSAFQDTAPELKGFIFADTRVADTNAVLPHLETQADMVFRGAF